MAVGPADGLRSPRGVSEVGHEDHVARAQPVRGDELRVSTEEAGGLIAEPFGCSGTELVPEQFGQDFVDRFAVAELGNEGHGSSLGSLCCIGRWEQEIHAPIARHNTPDRELVNVPRRRNLYEVGKLYLI